MTQKTKSKTAMNLLEKYSQSYAIIMNENMKLKQLLEDSEINLSITKNLLNKFTSDNNKSDNMLYIKTYEDENMILKKRIDQLSSELDDMNYKYSIIEQTLIHKSRGDAELISKLEEKVFLLENKLEEKKSIIKSFTYINTKIKKMIHTIKNEQLSIDYIESNPTQNLLSLSNQYNNLLDNYNILSNKFKVSTQQKKNITNEKNRIQDENDRLKELLKEQVKYGQIQYKVLNNEIQKSKRVSNTKLEIRENREYKENELLNNYANSYLEDEKFKRDKKSNNNSINEGISCFSDMNKGISNAVLKNIENVQCDSYVEVLKLSRISSHDIKILKSSSNIISNKVSEALEIFERVLMDKEVHIELLISENEKLSKEINKLNELLNIEIISNDNDNQIDKFAKKEIINSNFYLNTSEDEKRIRTCFKKS